MENIYAMIARVDFLDEVRENEKKKAAERLQEEMRIFVAHIGHSYVYECKSTGLSYELMDDGTILAKDEDSNKEQRIELNLYLEEMELIREHLVEVLNAECLYIEDEIGRYQKLCL